MENHRWLYGVAVLASVVTCAGQTAPSRVDAPTAAALLADSEIQYVESGGFAGRTHEAHMQATNGRVEVRYRPPDVRGPDGTQAGVVDADVYVALWREADRLDLWTLESPRGSPGADLIQYELRIRRGTRAHVVRWDEGASLEGRLRDGAAWAQKVLATAREYAACR